MSHQKRDEQVLEDTVVSRRHYEVPAVIESAVFETLALACGKTVGVNQCDFILGTSAS